MLTRAEFVELFATATATASDEVPPHTPSPAAALSPMSVSTPDRPPEKLLFDSDAQRTATHEHALLRDKIDELTELLAGARDELRHVKQQHASAEQTVRQQHDALARAQQLTDGLQEQIKLLSRQLEAARGQIDDLSTAVREVTAVRADEQRKAEAAAKKAELRQQASMAEMTLLRKQLATAENQLTDQCDATNDALERSQALETLNGALQAKLQLLDARCGELGREVAALKEANERAAEELELLQVHGAHGLPRSDSTPPVYIATPTATPAKAGLFHTPATPGGGGPAVMTLVDEIVQAVVPASAAATPATPATDAALLASVQSLTSMYVRSVAHADELSLRISKVGELRDAETSELQQRLDAALSQQHRLAQELQARAAAAAAAAASTRASMQETSTPLWLACALFAIYFGMWMNAYATSSTLPGYRASWPS